MMVDSNKTTDLSISDSDETVACIDRGFRQLYKTTDHGLSAIDHWPVFGSIGDGWDFSVVDSKWGCENRYRRAYVDA